MHAKTPVTACLFLATGLLIGPWVLPAASTPAQPAVAAVPARPDSELEALRGELRDAQDRITLLRKEIAEQNQRHQALEAVLSGKAPRHAPGAAIAGGTSRTRGSGPSGPILLR